MLNKKYLIILLIITIVTFLPRVIEVFNPYNYFFNQEQGILYLLTKSIVIDHHILLTAPQGGNPQGGFGNFFKGPGYNYLLAIPFILFAGDPFGGRLFMFFISVLTVSLAFILVNKMFGIKEAGLISILLAISPGLKDYAGNIWPPSVMPILTVIFLYFLYKVFQKQFKFVALLSFTVGLMAHFEMATTAVLFILLALTALVAIFKKTVPYRYYLFAFISFNLALLPLFIYDLEHNFYNIKGLLSLITQTQIKTAGHASVSIFNLISNRLDVFKWNFLSTFSPSNIIWPILLILGIIGIYLILRDKKVIILKKAYIFYLTLIPILTFPILIIYPGTTAPQWWIMNLSVIYCFIFGITLNYFWTKNKLKPLVIAILFVLFSAYVNRTYFIYKTQYIPNPSNYIKENVAINYVYKDSQKKPFGIFAISANGQENYDYLIWWNGHAKYHYQPYKEKKGLCYILIEPDSLKSSTNRNNLKSLEAGTLIFSKKLTNGFIIEKRLIK